MMKKIDELLLKTSIFARTQAEAFREKLSDEKGSVIEWVLLCAAGVALFLVARNALFDPISNKAAEAGAKISGVTIP